MELWREKGTVWCSLRFAKILPAKAPSAGVSYGCPKQLHERVMEQAGIVAYVHGRWQSRRVNPSGLAVLLSQRREINGDGSGGAGGGGGEQWGGYGSRND